MTKEEMRQKAEAIAKELPSSPIRDTAYWPAPPYSQIFKCGVLPYRQLDGGNVEYYLFKPETTMPEKGDPGFQICKGTREIYNPETEEWDGYRSSKQLKENVEENLEPLKVTAVREGIEEIGLKAEYIIAAAEWGQAAFTSETTGELKTMWLYPLQMQADCEFDMPHEEEANTIAREWFDIHNEEQAEKIRNDHLNIIRKIDKVLRNKAEE